MAPVSGMLTYQQTEYCNRCGFCLAVCPTYRETGVETQSPRGRLALIAAAATGDLPITDRLAEQLGHCLDCRACEGACPAGVRIAHYIRAARAQLAQGRPQPFLKGLVLRRLLPQPSVLNGLAWAARLGQGLPVTAFLPLHLRRAQDLLPNPLPPPLRKSLPEVVLARGPRKLRVGFFLGCVMDLAFSNVSRATVRVLSENGYEVVTPREQRCCGAPHETEGDEATHRALAWRNIAAFEDKGIDLIVTDCAACGAALKGYAGLLGEGAKGFSARVRDITEVLVGAPLEGELHPLPYQVAYHEPCHLVHAQKVSAQPRALLGAIPGLTLRELPEATWCCGGGGSYVLTHHQRSMQVLDRKMAAVAESGAEVVATGNPGCLMQLRLGARRHGLKVRLAHPMELLAEAYGRPA